eukprot:6174299-Pleurochrysis_carterae.AAC.1
MARDGGSQRNGNGPVEHACALACTYITLHKPAYEYRRQHATAHASASTRLTNVAMATISREGTSTVLSVSCAMSALSCLVFLVCSQLHSLPSSLALLRCMRLKLTHFPHSLIPRDFRIVSYNAVAPKGVGELADFRKRSAVSLGFPSCRCTIPRDPLPDRWCAHGFRGPPRVCACA